MSRLVRGKFSSILSLPDLLLAPLRALMRGHLTLITFTCIIAIPIWFSFLLCGNIISQIIVRLLGAGSALAQLMPSLVFTGIWIIALPFFLTAVILPIRLIWHNEKLSISALCLDFFGTFQKASKAVLLAAAPLLALSLLFIGAYNLAPYLVSKLALQFSTVQVGVVLCSLVSLILIKKILQFAIFPISSVALNLGTREAALATAQALRSRGLIILVVLALAGLALVKTNMYLHADIFTLKNVSAIEAASYAVIIWYLLSTLSVFILAASENEAANYLQALRQAATPIRIQRTEAKPKVSEIHDDTRKRKVLASKHRRATTALTPKDLELMFR